MASRLLALALGVLGLGLQPVVAQCTDFTPGWGFPGNGLNSTVFDLDSFDDGSGSRLVAAGRFSGSPNAVVCAWDGSSWQSIATSTASSDEARALAVHDDGTGATLYAAGRITTVGGVSVTNIAKRVSTNWQPLGSGVNGTVEAIASFDDGSGPMLYAVGTFTTAGGLPAPNVARWNGSAWQVAGALVGTPHALAIFDGGSGPQLYVAGNLNAGPLQRWNGTSWSVVPGISWSSATRWALAVHDDGSGVGSCLYLGGSFSAPDDNLARWNGSQWLPMPGTLTGRVSGLGVFREAGVDHLFVAGPNSFNGADYGRIARWNGSTWSPLGFGIGYTSGNVYALQPQDDGNGERLFLGGTFLNMGGLPASGIARFGEPCGLPVVTSQPQSVQLRPEQAGGSHFVALSVQATGTQPLSYQWFKDGSPLSNSVDVSGATLSSLELYRWNASTVGDYTCAVTNGVGTVYSLPATVSIPSGPGEETWEYPPYFLPPRALDSHPGATVVTYSSAIFASDGSAILLGDIDQNGTVAPGRFALVQGSTSLIARAGMPAPQCEAGTVFQGTVASPLFPAAGGQVAFRATLLGYTLPDGSQGIFHFDGSQLALVARSGSTLPGLAPGETVRDLSDPGTADSGLVAFRAKIFSGSTWLGTGLWSWTPTTGAQLELRTGQAAPGSTAIVLSFASSQPQVVTPDGRILIDVTLNTNTGWKRSIVPPNDVLVLLGPPGALQKVVQSGDVSPGYPPVCNFEYPWAMLPTPDGLIITSWIAGPSLFVSMGMYRWNSSGLSLLARRGNSVPGAPAAITFNTMTPLAVNANGDVAFEATYLGSCTNCGTRALCVRRGGTLHRVYDNGLALPPFTPTGMTPQSYSSVRLDDRGRLALTVGIGIGSSIWSYTLGWSEERGPFVLAGEGWQHALPGGGTDTLWGASPASHFVGDLLASGPPLATGRFLALSLSHARNPRGLFIADFDAAANNLLGPAEFVCSGDGASGPCPCGNTGGAGLGCANSVGTGAGLAVTGSALLARDDLAFQISGVPSGAAALLFQTGQLLAAPSTLGDGLKCAGGLSKRLGLRQADSLGQAAWGPGLAASGGWSAGTSQIFQVWYRDLAGSPCNQRSNTTNALRVTFTP